MTQSGRRYASEADSLQSQDRTPARGVETTDMDHVEGADHQATPFIRRRKRAALILAPMMVLGLASTAFALGPQTQEPQMAAPAAAAAAPSQAPIRDVNQGNRNAARPSITASSPPATSSAPSTTAPSTTAVPTTSAAPTTKAPTTKAPTTKAPTSKAPATTTAKPVTAGLAAVTGTRYTTTGLNVRSQASTSAKAVTSLAKGSKVSITSVKLNGFTQISMNGKAAYVSSDYLTKTAPKTSSTPATTSTKSATSSSKSTGASKTSGGLGSAACGKVSGIESGLSTNARNAARAICNAFPNVSSFGGYRSSNDAHGAGRAVDAMISGQAGWEVANWVRANASSLGVTEVIYAQKIWTTQRSGEGWRSMSDRGSSTANHYDHVHVTVR